MHISKPIVITGAAGFIGAALTKELIRNGENILGIDNLNNYYDPNLKKNRLNEIYLLNKKLKAEFKF